MPLMASVFGALIIGFVLGSALFASTAKSMIVRMEKEISFLHGIVDRRDDHQKRLDRVKYGLHEVESEKRTIDDPPKSLQDLCLKFSEGGRRMLMDARRMHSQGTPWNMIEQAYLKQIADQGVVIEREDGNAD